MKPNRRNRILLAAIWLTLATPSAFAANLYWDTNDIATGSGAATGIWGTNLYWSTDANGLLTTANTTTTGVDDLFFSAGTNGTLGTVTVNGIQKARLLTLEEGALTYTGGTISLGGGGGITVLAGAGNAIISSSLTISGNNIINVGSGRTLTLQTGTFTRNAGATVNIQGAGIGSSTMTGLNSNVNRIIGPWASVGTGTTTTYAILNGASLGGLVYAASPTASQGTAVTATTGVISTASPGTVNYSLTVSAGGSLGASANINTLRYTGIAGTLATNTSFTTKGIMNSGTGKLTFSGAVTSGASSTEMVVNAANADIDFNGIFTGTITKTGSGTMTLGGTVAHSLGGITVNEGTLRGVVVGTSLTPTSPFGSSTIILNGGTLSIQASGTVSTAAQTVTFGNNVEVAGDGTIDVNRPGATSTTKTMAMGTLSIGTNSLQVTHGNAYKLSFGATTLTGNATFNPSTSAVTSLTLGAVGQSGGPRNLTKSGLGLLILDGAGSYTGSTTVSAGSLVLGHVSALGGNNPGVNGTSAISMATGTTLRSTVSGVTVSAPITTTGSVTIGAPANNPGSQAFSELILNGAIGGAGTTNVNFNSFLDANTIQTVTLGAANTYSGTTTIGSVGFGVDDSQVFVKLGINDALPTTTILSIQGGIGSGTGRGIGLNLFGYNQTLAGLINTAATARIQQIVNSNVSAAATLTIKGDADTTYTGFLGSNNANFSVNATANPGSTNGNNFGLTKDGTGTFTLDPATFVASGTTWSGNSFSGPTKILGGILSLGVDNAMSQSPLDTLNSVSGNGTRGLRTTVTTLTMGGLTGDKNLVDVFTDATGGPANTTANGGYDGLTALTLNPVSGATHTYSGDIGNGNGSMSLTKSGLGTQVLTTTQTYTGATSINAGTLQLDGSTHASSTVSIGTAGALTGSGTVNGNATLTGGGIINKSSGTIAGTLGVTGGKWNGAGAVTGLVTSSSGTFSIGSGANLTANGDLSVTGGSITAGDSTSTITGSVDYTSGSNSTFAGNITGSSKTLTLNNAGATLTLSGTNGYTGATTVTAGTLLVNGSTGASSAVTVAAGTVTGTPVATLGGNGTINGTLNLAEESATGFKNGGVLAPGGPGVDIKTLNAGTTTWNGGSIWNFDLSSSDTTSDKLNITGNFVKGTGSGFEFNFMGSTPLWNTTYTLAQWSDSLSGFVLSDFDAAASRATLGSGSYSTSYFTIDGSTLTFTAVPEPTSALAGLLIGAGLLRRRRK